MINISFRVFFLVFASFVLTFAFSSVVADQVYSRHNSVRSVPVEMSQVYSYFETKTAVYKVTKQFRVNRSNWKGYIYKLIQANSTSSLSDKYCFSYFDMNLQNSMQQGDFMLYFELDNDNPRAFDSPPDIVPRPFPFGAILNDIDAEENEFSHAYSTKPIDIFYQLPLSKKLHLCSESLERINANKKEASQRETEEEEVEGDEIKDLEEIRTFEGFYF